MALEEYKIDDLSVVVIFYFKFMASDCHLMTVVDVVGGHS